MSGWMFLLVVFLTAMLLTGDYIIKFATTSQYPVIALMIAGLFWCLSIPGWYYTVKDERLAIVGMLFSVLSLVGTVLIGMVCFGERLNMKEWVGFCFAVAAAIMLSGKV